MAYSDYYSTNMNDASTGGLLAAFGHIWLFTMIVFMSLSGNTQLFNY